ncbi:MAG: tetratricopeptide repeat protein [Candidatus Riflebacteria bacterium]|nr:tetratricopeptide repeat protein [Candidatus Riflebacteria bacterium]
MEAALELFQKGVDLQQRGLFDHAIEEYEKALKLEPDNIDVLVNLGAACLQKGMSERAVKILTLALNKDPENSLVLYNLGKAFIYREEYETALSTFQKALDILPGDNDIKKLISKCLRLMGRYRDSVEIMLGLIDVIATDSVALLELAGDLKMLERFDEALDVFRRASSVACDSVEPLRGIYECQLRLGNREKAMTALKRAIMIEPFNQPLLVNLADLFLADGRIQEAVDVISRGMETVKDPRLLQEKYNEMARRLPVLKKKAAATMMAVRQSPFETEVYDVLDALYDGRVGLDVAVKELEALRSREPSDILIADELANLLFQARQFDRAAEIYSELYLGRPRETSHRVSLARSLAMKGDVEAARTILKDSVRDLGHVAELDLALAELDLFEKEFLRAAGRLEIILKEHPGEMHALFLYAYTALRLDELELAEKTFHQLFEKNAADEELAVWYARLSILQGNPERALKIWEGFSDGMESLVEIISKVELTLFAGDSKGIMKHLHKIGDYHPRFIEDHLLFGKAFFFAGDFAAAQREFDLVLRLESRNAEALAMSAMTFLIRNKSAKFWNYWQRAIECDSIYAVLPALILKNSINFSQKERLKTETRKLIEIASISDADRSRLKRLLQSL